MRVHSESRFDSCLNGRRHLGIYLKRDPKSAEAFSSCHVPMVAETADSNEHQFPTPTREWLRNLVSLFNGLIGEQHLGR
jgi:hypothetical protein